MNTLSTELHSFSRKCLEVIGKRWGNLRPVKGITEKYVPVAHVFTFCFQYNIVIFDISEPKNRFTRYPSWNTKMYPIWKDGDPRYIDSWKGTFVEILLT